ncbi:TlpA family protein disulfide reductase [Paracidovorax sp. MALMAid1276]|uniref:TlpA family protein disulfide reductase n=1 Tax=Paracidovorax sp. MALMAid1276 TaxID=3411631 RepID=UPI003B9AD1B3
MTSKRGFLQACAACALGAASGAVPQALAQPAAAPPGPKHTLTGTDSEGKPIALTDFAGKVCLVSFFTAGCALCTHELRLLREFYTNNRHRDFVLLGVNLDEKRADFAQYIELLKVSVPPEQRFPIAWRGAGGHQDSFGAITRRPTHYVLNRQHQQVLRREGNFLPTDWDDLWTSLA